MNDKMPQQTKIAWDEIKHAFSNDSEWWAERVKLVDDYFALQSAAQPEPQAVREVVEKLMPKIMTHKMMQAWTGLRIINNREAYDLQHAYDEMYEAAPEPAEGGGE